MSTDVSSAGRRGRSVVAGLAAALVALSSGCTIPTAAQDAGAASSTAAAPAVGSGTTAETAAEAAPEPNREGFTESFEAFSAGLAGTVGVAVGAVGGDGPVELAGEWASGPAWSTIKVPLAIAALETGGSEPGGAARSAITVSDNAAAEQLWAGLGAPEEAALAVEGVLQAFGDQATIVPPTRSRPEFSIFGQTDWSLSDQARFGAALPCRLEAAQVYGLMGQISGDQGWGLGAIPGAHFKGGWGPVPAGGYLVRQLGVIDTPTGQVAVAIAAETGGSFADGTALLSEVAQWVAANPRLLPPGGGC